MPETIGGQLLGIPVDMLAEPFVKGLRRLMVDPGSTGFHAGREFRTYLDMTITATPTVLRLTIPSTLRGIHIHHARVSCYQGGIHFKVFRAGTAGGSWTSLPIFPSNAIPVAPTYTRLTSLESGGTLTSPSQQTDSDIAFANDSGKSSATIAQAIVGDRGLGPGTYYIEFSRVSGVTIDGLGVLSMVWEEIPITDSWR